jgi:hypothetical protein
VRIRPFDADDVRDVAALWQYWFRDKTRDPDPDLVAWARRIYVERPGGDPEVPSLVAEGDGGEMLGFLGVTATPVLVDGQPRTLAGVFPSIVAPEAPTTVASFLLRKFVAGPQALTVSDGGHVVFERIWRLLGGGIAPTASLRWIKAFRPARIGLGVALRGRRAHGTLATLTSPLAGGADALARRAGGGWFRAAGTGDGYRSQPLTPADFVAAIETVHARTRLRPRYTEEYLAWLFAAMASIRDQGAFEPTLVTTAKGDIAGWWIAYLRPGRTSRVFALDGAERHLGGVVDQLFARADDAGVGALVGRLEPRLRAPLATRRTLVHNGGSLQMVHAADPTLRDDALLGRLAFSRLEGENWYWWAITSQFES